MKVLIKGNAAQAYEACDKRNISVAPCACIHSSDHETMLRISDGQELLVQKWFCEDRKAPYPIGACLFYSTEQKEVRAFGKGDAVPPGRVQKV